LQDLTTAFEKDNSGFGKKIGEFPARFSGTSALGLPGAKAARDLVRIRLEPAGPDGGTGIPQLITSFSFRKW